MILYICSYFVFYTYMGYYLPLSFEAFNKQTNHFVWPYIMVLYVQLRMSLGKIIFTCRAWGWWSCRWAWVFPWAFPGQWVHDESGSGDRKGRRLRRGPSGRPPSCSGGGGSQGGAPLFHGRIGSGLHRGSCPFLAICCRARFWTCPGCTPLIPVAFPLLSLLARTPSAVFSEQIICSIKLTVL